MEFLVRPVLVGVELLRKDDYDKLLQNLNKYQINYTELRKDNPLFSYLV
jgi:threonine dehydratase